MLNVPILRMNFFVIRICDLEYFHNFELAILKIVPRLYKVHLGTFQPWKKHPRQFLFHFSEKSLRESSTFSPFNDISA